MKVSIFRIKTLLLCLALICPSVIKAQSGSGAIQGTVQDSMGAVIPEAAIHVVNKATGVVTDTTSNESGFYVVPSLFAGDYMLSFSAPRMKTYQMNLTLQAAQTAVINPSLTPGAATEQITVTADTIQLATYNSATISSTLDSARISELPMNGRNVLGLVTQTVPGTENTLGSVRPNGLMGEAMEYVLDGAPLLNRLYGGEFNTQGSQLPDPDSVKEMRVEMTNSNARFATPATGIITTKSGTNNLHGSFFETARNNAIGIAKARQNPWNYSAPHNVRNEFGASIGGPIRFPHLYNGRDKSFFFFGFERLSSRSGASEWATVPMTAWRNGDFSGLTNSAGKAQILYDPATTDANGQRTVFTGNQINTNRQSQLSKVLMAITPQPTTADNPNVTPNLNTPNISSNTIPQFNFRLDHVFDESNRVFLRGSLMSPQNSSLRNSPTNEPATLEAAGLPYGASGLSTVLGTTDSAALGYTHIFSPTFFSETNVGQNWFSLYNGPGGSQPFLNYESKLGLPNNFSELGFPSITGGSIQYPGTMWGISMSQIITNVDENLTKIIGKHELLFGGRYRHERFGNAPMRLVDTTTFGNYGTANLDPASGANYLPVTNTGNADADRFLGAAASYSVNLNPSYAHIRDMEFDGYIQDDWHFTKSLTVNLGLRWEAHPAPHAANGTIAGFDLLTKAIVLQDPINTYIQKGATTQAIINNLTALGVKFETPAQAGIPQAMLYNYNFELSPRIGVAYMPFNGKYGTVIRGGFGRFIYPIPVRGFLSGTGTNEPFAGTYSKNYNLGSQSPDGLPNYLLRNPQSVIAGQNSTGAVDTTSTTAILPGINMNTVDPHSPPDSVIETSMTIEQPLKYNTVLRVSYLFVRATNVEEYNYYNFHPNNYVYEYVNGTTPPTGYYAGVATGPYDQTTYGNSSQLIQKTGYSNSNSLQVNLERAFKHGIAFQAYYVMDKTFRLGGYNVAETYLYPKADYLPGVVPGNQDLNRFENYFIDSTIPLHHFNFNALVDIPVGRGKRFFGNTNHFSDQVIGGWKLSATGLVVTQWFQVSATHWGATNPIHLYKQHPVTDCRSGVCRKENLWFNGFISPSQINAATNGISGLPSDYQPYLSPINVSANNDNVPLTLKSGTIVTLPYYAGPQGANPFSKTFLQGPINYNANLSLFKVFPIGEKVKLGVNLDAFNAFNIQGYINPSTSDGTQNFLSSYWSPRQIQLSARLTF